MVTHWVVASVPFLEKMAQSAWSTVAVMASASSTIRGDGPFWQSALGRLAGGRLVHPGMTVAEEDGP
jgi:hypothetical protein